MAHKIKYLETHIISRGRRVINYNAAKCEASKTPSPRDSNPVCNNKAGIEIDGKRYCYLHAQIHALDILIQDCEANGNVIN
jgi:hypothetical protein